MDVSVASLAVLAIRSIVIDYTIPLYIDKSTLLEHRNVNRQNKLNLYAYFDIFSKTSRLGIAVVALGLTMFLYWVFKSYLSKDIGFTLNQAFAEVLLSLIQRNYTSLAIKSTSKRYSYYTVLLFGTMIYLNYTALLTSTMIFAPRPTPIKTFQDVIDKEYKLVLLKGTSQHLKFLLAPEGSHLNKIKTKLLDNNPK